MSSASICFIGLGMMGVPMATNLLVAGHAVLGFDTQPEAAATLAAHASFTSRPVRLRWLALAPM